MHLGGDRDSQSARPQLPGAGPSSRLEHRTWILGAGRAVHDFGPTAGRAGRLRTGSGRLSAGRWSRRIPLGSGPGRLPVGRSRAGRSRAGRLPAGRSRAGRPPAGTGSLALLADDPDAPVGNWNHWVLWNLPAESRQLAENVAKSAQLPDGSRQGLNDFRKTGYNGPCPPPGKPHRYYFKIFALDAKLDLKGNVGKRELEAAMKGHILAQAEWMGRYGR